MLKKDEKALLAKAKSLGATDAKFIDVKKIKVGAWTRMKCQFGCPNYGQTLCCPPYAPTYDATQAFLKEYKKAMLVQFTSPMPQGKKVDWVKVDMDISNGLLKLLLGVEREAFLLNYYKSFALKAGRCRLCKECNLKKCVHPLEARPSMEACGIDVMALANDNGYKAEILTGPVKELKIYGLVLVD